MNIILIIILLFLLIGSCSIKSNNSTYVIYLPKDKRDDNLSINSNNITDMWFKELNEQSDKKIANEILEPITGELVTLNMKKK